MLMRRGENPSEVLRRHPRSGGRAERHPPAARRAHRRRSTTARIWSTTRCTPCRHTLLEGLVIVVAVLFLFLGSVRAALLTAITIPLSLLFAFVCMHFTGIPANLLSLGALDFGIIVDGTLVMVEHIVSVTRAAQGQLPRRRDRQTAFRQRPATRFWTRRSKSSGPSSSRCSSSSPPTFRCSRWSAWSGGCSRRWRSRSATRCSARCCWR